MFETQLGHWTVPVVAAAAGLLGREWTRWDTNETSRLIIFRPSLSWN